LLFLSVKILLQKNGVLCDKSAICSIGYLEGRKIHALRRRTACLQSTYDDIHLSFLTGLFGRSAKQACVAVQITSLQIIRFCMNFVSNPRVKAVYIKREFRIGNGPAEASEKYFTIFLSSDLQKLII